jgi:hypothetical protein
LCGLRSAGTQCCADDQRFPDAVHTWHDRESVMICRSTFLRETKKTASIHWPSLVSRDLFIRQSYSGDIVQRSMQN